MQGSSWPSSTVLACCCWLLIHARAHAWRVQYDINNRIDSDDLDEIPISFDERINLIYPGTKWCGSGNVAAGPDDLGKHKESDACCREHDLCADVIEAGETKHGLTNPSFYTRLECSCDEKFYDCLHRSEEGAGRRIGFLYFSILNTKCYREDYPIAGCRRPVTFPRRCLEYELDTSQPKKYQWFDVPPYK
ncbi:phospholipase A2 [Megalopta genalis]|uniref:phospholipase A2 n=1 Tax=Megalopta genalis TaxID=115081 RepID=UPI003FD1F774